jgi:putative membrane protein
MMWGNYGMSGWSWGFGGLVVIGAVILIFVLLRRQSPSRIDASSALPAVEKSTPSPKQILDDRYAKGELTTAEYQERIVALGLNT